MGNIYNNTQYETYLSDFARLRNHDESGWSSPQLGMHRSHASRWIAWAVACRHSKRFEQRRIFTTFGGPEAMTVSTPDPVKSVSSQRDHADKKRQGP